MRKFCTALAICLMLINIMTSQVYAVTTLENSITDLTVTAEDCNIILELSTDNQFHFDYESNTFDLKVEDGNSSKTIHVSKKPDVGRPVQFVTIQIPNFQYNQVNFNLENVGVSIPAINCDVNVDADESAVTVNIPANFNKSLTYHNTKGAGTIKFQSELANVKFVLDANESAVAIPDGWPRYKAGKSYTYQVGDVTGNINADIEECSFSVKLINKSDVKALDIMQRTGNWGYIVIYLPEMTNAGIDAVVNSYNSKHPNSNEHKKASNYYN